MNMIIRDQMNERLLFGMHSIFEESAQRANRRVGKNADERITTLCKDGGYKCIHLNPGYFIYALSGLLDRNPVPNDKIRFTKFLDIGCGVGEKVYLASLFGLSAWGLELRRPLITEGKSLFKRLKVPFNVIQGDALKVDYNSFDILYFYCPLCDHELQCQLEYQIATTAKVGAIVLPVLAQGCFNQFVNDKTSWPDNFQQNWRRINYRCECGDSTYWIRRA